MTKTQYDKIAEKYSGTETPTKMYCTVPTFLKMVGNVTGKSAIDLACGTGYFTRKLAELGANPVVGTDISEGMIKIAREIESQAHQGIEYIVSDASKLRLARKFDLASAVFLLNYAKDRQELAEMCSSVYRILGNHGKFYTILPHPESRPVNDFKYRVKQVSLSGRDYFEDGEKMKVIFQKEDGDTFEAMNYFWSRNSIENALTSAGFRNIQWIDMIVSKEGIAKFGEEYWRRFLEHPTTIGLVCEKPEEAK